MDRKHQSVIADLIGNVIICQKLFHLSGLLRILAGRQLDHFGTRHNKRRQSDRDRDHCHNADQEDLLFSVKFFPPVYDSLQKLSQPFLHGFISSQS